MAHRRRVRAGAAAALVLLAVAAAWILRPTPALPPGRVALDALPWARVTSVVDAEGVPVVDAGGASAAVARDLYTPVVLSLAPGTYEITVENPDFPGDRTVRVEVTAAVTTTRSVELGATNVDAYFAAAGLAEALQKAGS